MIRATTICASTLALCVGVFAGEAALRARGSSSLARFDALTAEGLQTGAAPVRFRELLVEMAEAIAEGPSLTIRIVVTNEGADRIVEVGAAQILDAQGNEYQSSRVQAGPGGARAPLDNAARIGISIRFDRLPTADGVVTFSHVVRLSLRVAVGSSTAELSGAAGQVDVWNFDIQRKVLVPPPDGGTVAASPPKSSEPVAGRGNRTTQRQPPQRSSVPDIPAPPAPHAPMRTGGAACRPSDPTPRIALDRDVVIWVRDDGRVAERSLDTRAAVFAVGNGSPRQVGGSFADALTDDEWRSTNPPTLVKSVSNAVGVAIVPVLWFGTTRTSLLGGLLTSETEGLQLRATRVAFLAGGGLAVWNAIDDVVLYASATVRAVLGTSIESIHAGRFVLADGTIEDGVIERLRNQREVMRALVRGLGGAVCDSCPASLSPRPAAARSSFKYSWSRNGTPVRCVATIAHRAVLRQDGTAYSVPDEVLGGVVDETPLMRDVATISGSADAMVVVQRDGSMWYARRHGFEWSRLSRVPGVSGVQRAWVAAAEEDFDAPLWKPAPGEPPSSVPRARYLAGAWFTSGSGQLFRWAESAESMATEAQRDIDRPPANPLAIDQVVNETAAPVVVERARTALITLTGSIVAFMPAGVILHTSRVNAIAGVDSREGGWVAVGDTGPGRVRLIDPIAIEPARSLQEPRGRGEITQDRAVLFDPTRGRTVAGVAADGAAELVLAVPMFANSTGVTLSIAPSECLAAQRSQACTQSIPPVSEAGAFLALNRQGAVPTATLDVPSEPARESVAGTDAPRVAFAVYRAPSTFARKSRTGASGSATCAPGYDAEDCSALRRTVAVRVRRHSADGKDVNSYDAIEIVRPPVLLLHGFNSDATTWAPMARLLTARRIAGGTTLDYSNPIGISELQPDFREAAGRIIKAVEAQDVHWKWPLLSPKPDLTPAWYTGSLSEVPRNAIGVEWNANRILELGFLDRALSCFKGETPVASCDAGLDVAAAPSPVAAVRFDVVGHDMGGLVAEAIAQNSSSRTAANYGAGPIHKLITVGTPHLGSKLLDWLTNGSHACTAVWTALGTIRTGARPSCTSPPCHDRATPPLLLLRSVTPLTVVSEENARQGRFDGAQSTNGAAFDLAGDGTPNVQNPLLKKLHDGLRTMDVPVATIAGFVDPSRLVERSALLASEPVDWIRFMLRSREDTEGAEQSDWSAASALCGQHFFAPANMLDALKDFADPAHAAAGPEGALLLRDAMSTSFKVWTYWQLDRTAGTHILFGNDLFALWLDAFAARAPADATPIDQFLGGIRLESVLRVLESSTAVAMTTELFGVQSDGLTEVLSASAGAAEGPGARVIPDVLHDARTARNLGVNAPTLQDEPRVADWIATLLNGSGDDAGLFTSRRRD